jgi:hypothetical protein
VRKSFSKWLLVITLGFAAVFAIAASAQKQSCTTCPIVQMLKGIRTCQVAEPNLSLSEPEPNSKQAQSNQ